MNKSGLGQFVGLCLRAFTAAIIIVLIAAGAALAWPTDAQWVPMYKDGLLLQDSNSDTNGSRNVVSDLTHDAAFMYNDGTYIYFRLRLDDTPAGSGGQGLLKPYGWGVEIDSNMDPRAYEWLIMVDGISQSENISLWQNTSQRIIGDPGDKPEILSYQISLSGNYRILVADTSFNNSQDYFLDWRFPYDIFKQKSGISDTTPIRLFFGSSSSTDTLTESGADLVGASDLLSGFSDYVIPLMSNPTTGSVMFVANLAGTGDVTSITQGDTIYIKVTDADRNVDTSTAQTVYVTLTNQNGDSESVMLTETGVNTGVFTASIPTAASISATHNDGVLQVRPGETVTVTYIDAIDANRILNQSRTDTLTVAGPSITVTKTVNLPAVTSGSTVTYTITITNTGGGDGWLASIKDTLPGAFTYVPGSSAGLTTSDPTINGQELSWAGSWTVTRKIGAVNGTATLTFQALALGNVGTYYNSAVVSGTNIPSTATGNTASVILSAPQITLTKSVDNASAIPGTTVTYTVYYRNIGNADAKNIVISDTIPENSTYVPGSLRMGGPGTTYATAVAKTDAADGDESEISGNKVIFRVTTVNADDAATGAGADEGKVFFQVIIN